MNLNVLTYRVQLPDNMGASRISWRSLVNWKWIAITYSQTTTQSEVISTRLLLTTTRKVANNIVTSTGKADYGHTTHYCTVRWWHLDAGGTRQITAAHMKFFRKTAKYTLFDHETNQDLWKNLKTPSNYINWYNTRSEWADLDSRKLLRNTNQQERGTKVIQGHPLKRLLDCYTGTGWRHGAKTMTAWWWRT
jgi:hypothetical protein